MSKTGDFISENFNIVPIKYRYSSFYSYGEPRTQVSTLECGVRIGNSDINTSVFSSKVDNELETLKKIVTDIHTKYSTHNFSIYKTLDNRYGYALFCNNFHVKELIYTFYSNTLEEITLDGAKTPDSNLILVYPRKECGND